MIETLLRPRVAACAGLLALVGFWVLVVVAGRIQPGYEADLDRLSAAAAHGAEQPWVAMLAILVLAFAYLATALVLRGWVGTRFGFLLLLGASAATAVVAFARIDCPSGAAGCARNESDELLGPAVENVEGLVHTVFVAVAYVLVATAMLWLAQLWWRRGRRRIRAALSAGAFVASLITVPFWTSGDSPGAAQRVWLGILSAWVVLVLVRPLVDTPSAVAGATDEEA